MSQLKSSHQVLTEDILVQQQHTARLLLFSWSFTGKIKFLCCFRHAWVQLLRRSRERSHCWSILAQSQKLFGLGCSGSKQSSLQDVWISQISFKQCMWQVQAEIELRCFLQTNVNWKYNHFFSAFWGFFFLSAPEIYALCAAVSVSWGQRSVWWDCVASLAVDSVN